MSTETTPVPELSTKRHIAYRGRVRTGCLICRSRKVKCDESRPVCNNCTRLSRACVYGLQKPKRLRNRTVTESGHGPSPPLASVDTPSSASLETRSPHQWERDPNVAASRSSLRVQANAIHGHNFSITDLTVYLRDALQSKHERPIPGRDLESESAVDSPSTLISRDIRLTTTMDLLTAQEDPLQSLLSFFINQVDCHVITPYDSVNWQRMKLEVAQLGKAEPAVMSAIMALSALYKAQLYGLPRSKALSFYHVSKREYAQLLADPLKNPDVSLVVAFLLCIFTFIHYDTISVLKDPSEDLAAPAAAWTQTGAWSQSPLSCRIIAWFRLLQTATMRGGGTGLLSDRLYNAMPHPSNDNVPNLHPRPGDDAPSAASEMYSLLSQPLTHFYFRLQHMSMSIARLTHYHRSRATGQDQDQVTSAVARIKTRLRTLWDDRSAPQRQTPSSLRAHLAPSIAEPLITLAGVCEAAYHAEFIEMHRLLGDPVTEHDHHLHEAMRRIREIVDGGGSSDDSTNNDDNADVSSGEDWNACDRKGRVRVGYLRPLFLYAIECMDRAENAWAVERLRRISNDAVCRSEFFAAFAEALGETQLRKQRRVTSKYFSIWYFGMPPPFL